MNLDVIIANLPKLSQGAVLTLELVALSLLVGAAIALPRR